MAIHSTAIIDAGADVHPTCDIGPYCVVGPQVVLGAHTRLIAHVVVQNRTRMGAHNVVHPFASLGGEPQDLKYRGEPTALCIGDHNVFRENVTLNIGTQSGRQETTVGSHCLMMAYAHVAHDCTIGDHVVLANGVALAGHVDIDDQAIVGGLAAVHQHCRIGRLAFVGGGSMVAQDVLPFCTAQGDRATLAGLNVVGLRRSAWDHGRIRTMRRALLALFDNTQSRQQALQQLEDTLAQQSDDVESLCQFVRSATRGICRMRPAGPELTLQPLPHHLARQARDAC